MNNYIILFLAVFLTLGCSGKRKLISIEKLKKKPTASSLVTHLQSREIRSEWLTAKAKLHYEDDLQTMNATLTLRMRKDSIIWMSIRKYAVEAARVKITPDSVFVINRLEKSFAIIPLDLLEEQYSIPANFTNLESLIRGGIPFDSKQLRLLDIGQQFYSISNDEDAILSTNVQIDREELLLKKVKVRASDKLFNMSLEDYAEMEDKQIFSYLRQIEIVSKTLGQVSCHLNFSKVEFAIPKNIRFEIPEKYTRVEF